MKMHKGEVATNYQVSPLTRKESNNTRCDVPVKQMCRTWMKTFLDCGFG